MPAVPRREPPSLLPHVEALDLLWGALCRSGEAPAGGARFRKRFPERGAWHWESLEGDRWREVRDPATTVWLDARWAVTERLFYGHAELLPRLRPPGEGAPRPVEGWEWSCIGLHRLFAAWCSDDGRVRADLRPALLAFDGSDDYEPERLRDYELFYPAERVEALAEDLRAAAASSRRGRARWRDTIEACVVRHNLAAGGRPRDVLDRLTREGLARRRGRRVEVAVDGGAASRAVRTSTFRHAAGQALGACP